MRTPLLFLSLLLLTGCAMDASRLHDLNPQASDFPSALASEYEAYADSEKEQGHFLSANHFANKGLKALAGETVDPEDAENIPEAAEGRATLLKLLTPEIKKDAPQQAARAQLLFDCWQHELRKKQDQEQSPCADAFKSGLSELQEAADPLIYGQEITETISFAPQSADIDSNGINTIKSVAHKVSGVQHYRVQLDAYVTSATQRKLTDTRIAAVRRALINEKVSERSIHSKKTSISKAVILSDDDDVDDKNITITVNSHSSSKGH